MGLPGGIPGIIPVPGSQGSLLLFTDRDIVFSANNKTHTVKIADIILPLQPVVEIRLGRNWVTTEVAGSAANEKLSGTQIKENMGLSDAIITISGILLSSGSTLTQALRLSGGRENENIHWADKLKQIRELFEREESLPIYDWAPGEDYKYIPYGDIYHSWKGDPFNPKIRDMGVSMFEQLGIEKVVLLSFNLFERPGMERKGYTIRLQQDRDVSIEEIIPTEESGEGSQGGLV